MTHYLHKVTGILFFLLGISLFVAYLLMHNGIYASQTAWWIQRADLSFALTTLIYGGTGLYLSIHPKDKPSRALALTIGIPVAAFFVFLFILNFWEVLGLPQGEMLINL
ncbi:MAG: hypothetical protein K9M03_00700 [Kiritimatiellales bacterium]|nr:hypothetical protein [Kiritimatiellales bacterium]